MADFENRAEADKLVREILTGNVLLKDIEEDMRLNHKSLSEEQMETALMKALENPDTNDFDAGVIAAATMLRDGARLPDWLAAFTADVLEGKRSRPTKRGPDPYANWIRDYAIARAVLEVSQRFSLPEYTNNELSDKITAAQVVAETGHFSLDVMHKAIQKFGGRIKRITSPQDTKD